VFWLFNDRSVDLLIVLLLSVAAVGVLIDNRVRGRRR
jgi:hypothetical protein